MKSIRPVLTCLVALVAMSAAAQAGPLDPPEGPPASTMKSLSEVEPRIAIHQGDLPLTISVDGSYYLAENLVANQDGVDMITVTANNVSIDLMGFTIDGAGSGVAAADCIQIEQGVRTFGLTNGVIRGCGGDGVVTNFPFALTVSIDRVQANQNGKSGLSFGTGTFGVISRSVAKSNVERGILLAEGVLSECAAFSNGTIGLQLVYGVLSNCVARSNAGLNVVILSGGTSSATYAP
jgi:hypothetical protein